MFNVLYSLISSSDIKSPTILSESMISRIDNPVTRPVMQDIEWIQQRLCYMEGVLSARQVGILNSLKFPVVKPKSEDELNWDKSSIVPRQSHPMTRQISDLTKTKKDEYIKLRMKNRSITDAYSIANDYVPSKK